MVEPTPAVAMADRLFKILEGRAEYRATFNKALNRGDHHIIRKLITPICSSVEHSKGAMALRVQDLVLNKGTPLDEKIGIEDGEPRSRATVIVNAILTAGEDAMPNPIRMCASLP